MTISVDERNHIFLIGNGNVKIITTFTAGRCRAFVAVNWSIWLSVIGFGGIGASNNMALNNSAFASFRTFVAIEVILTGDVVSPSIVITPSGVALGVRFERFLWLRKFLLSRGLFGRISINTTHRSVSVDYERDNYNKKINFF